MNTRRRFLALASAGALLAGRRAFAADAGSFSEAERLLFTQDHFKSLAAAAKLDYEYRKRGSLEPEFTDRVRVSVSARKPTGKHDVKVDFLTGRERLGLQDVDDAEGNPLILYFLEREVREMNRLTGGSRNYYRKRIRIALAESAQVKPVTLQAGGKEVAAREIHIAPYRDDPVRSRYEKFAEKTFVLALSDQVPGTVVEMRSELLQHDEPTLVLAESVRYIARD
ncbi:MAG TPA: hypothetical protein VMG60_03355 [Burkholderiaceae bacterium]|nr:hypothetical protein [Burkholderiaceae bacterium]